MNDSDKKKPYGSLASRSAGGLVGFGIGSLLGPEFAAILTASGQFAGGSVHHFLQDKPNLASAFRNDISINQLIIAKLLKDFDYSIIGEPMSFQKATKDSMERISLLSEVKKRDYAKLSSKQSMKWVNENINLIRHCLKFNYIPDEIKKSIDIVNDYCKKMEKSISVVNV